MSLFGSLLGDIDDDPFFGGHMRQMNRMMRSMNSMFGQPLGGLMGPGMGSELMPFGGGGAMMPFGFPSMNMFQSMDPMGNNPACHSYSSSTVMTMTNGPDGRPQVYQASQSVRQGPGGVKETKKSVADSRTGVKKMAIGHHIGERAHIIEREQNLRTGDQEERQDYINLDEDEADEFNNEWRVKANRHFNSRRPQAAIGYHSAPDRYSGSRRHRDLPALPSSTSYMRKY
ncbi:myeloid leukemia factor-like isoform X2 [Macrosteles quadrilineatus]|uniref:myeloid leukemia factor-like isoform X2 n=1 Tax=Macrosteles quadrilineatus TaxID=74068 RepID=UPI0023E1745D|nr:myeloid leukemia factor-like isoform X2 [Macrosteles quadrilineatus]XP_054269450.1 myeloid leukemia factor-like isoform X2 [Macrosteles quadrilineatus]